MAAKKPTPKKRQKAKPLTKAEQKKTRGGTTFRVNADTDGSTIVRKTQKATCFY